MTARDWSAARAVLLHVKAYPTLPLDEARDRFEREVIADYLARTGGNPSEAVQLAGLQRVSLYRAMRRLGVRGRR
jgi:DNA-binding NtrC family response regulator